MKINKRFFFIAVLVLLSCTSLVLVHAQSGGGNTGTTLINPLQGNCPADGSNNGGCLMSFLQSILKFVVQIGSIVVILMLVFVGFKFVAARGNDSALVEARRMLLYTVIGALILLGAQAISLGIQATVTAISNGT